MAKQISSFVCQECGYDSPAYMGKCPECGAWNSFKEFHQAPSVKREALSRGVSAFSVSNEVAKPEPLRTVQQKPKERILTGFSEMDTVLGGGFVAGSATLLAGDPGIGKSTLLLQLCLNLAGAGNVISNKERDLPSSEKEISRQARNDNMKTVLYISGEESKEQVAMRAARLLGAEEYSSSEERSTHMRSNNTFPENLLLLSLTDVDQIIQIIQETKPNFIVIDSIQTVESQEAGGLSGSVSQIRYATSSFIRVAKTMGIPVILVGHVTKEGMVAGPMMLSHMVDTVLFLEGEKLTKTRILRSLKNRFGPVDEVGVFLMEGEGMQEVVHPEQIFLSTQNTSVPGSVLVVIMEGSRPFLIEIQALVVYSKFAMPKRVASGVDQRRLELLLAVLQKHAKMPLENYDVFVNVAGGIKVQDRAVDLGVCLAVFSSLKNKPLPNTVGIAEVGLLGELRPVGDLEKRIREAKKLGFSTILSSQKYATIPEVLGSLGYTGGSKQWKQEDERHFRIAEDEEE